MGNNIIDDYLKNRYGDKIEILKEDDVNLELMVSEGAFIEIAEYYKSRGYTFLADITSVDYKDHFMVVYQLFKYNKNQSVTIKVRLDNYKDPQITSLTGLWETADWHEREVYDLMGIKFPGHSNLKRILMWEGFEGHPLRKDFPEVTRKRKWEVE